MQTSNKNLDKCFYDQQFTWELKLQFDWSNHCRQWEWPAYEQRCSGVWLNLDEAISHPTPPLSKLTSLLKQSSYKFGKKSKWQPLVKSSLFKWCQRYVTVTTNNEQFLLERWPASLWSDWSAVLISDSAIQYSLFHEITVNVQSL